MKVQPGQVRDGISDVLRRFGAKGASMEQIAHGVDEIVGFSVPRSSVRSYLRLNTPGKFERLQRGHYRLTPGKGRR